MNILWVILGITVVLALIVAVILLICFHMAFYSPKRTPPSADEFPIPVGDVYEPFRESMVRWMKETRAMPSLEMSVTSFDGLTLRGKYYCYSPDAPIELMFHGYRGNSERDLCGGVQRCFKLGHSALIVDQRGCGTSDGDVITFGAKESRDCHTWVEHMIHHFGPDVKIILTGISMGAATVLIAAGRPLPKNVIGVLADCGYSSAEAIIKKVIVDMKLPPKASFPFVRLAGKLLGGFDLEDASPIQAVENCKLPVILFHGESDDFVPCEMSKEIYGHCNHPKKLVIIPGAGHGLSYPVDPKGYLRALKDFWNDNT